MYGYPLIVRRVAITILRMFAVPEPPLSMLQQFILALAYFHCLNPHLDEDKHPADVYSHEVMGVRWGLRTTDGRQLHVWSKRLGVLSLMCMVPRLPRSPPPCCPPPLDQSRSRQDVVEVGRRARLPARYRRTQWCAGEETRGGRRRGRWRAPEDALPRTQKVLWNFYPPCESLLTGHHHSGMIPPYCIRCHNYG